MNSFYRYYSSYGSQKAINELRAGDSRLTQAAWLLVMIWMFPYLKLKKQNRRWTIRMAVGEELYFYQYPFLFPNYFISYQNKYDLEIKLQLIESFSTVGLEKRFPVRNFLNQFSVPNKELKKIKKQLVDSFSTLKGSELIENEFSLNYKNGSSKKVEDLTSIMISKSESLSFWEKI